MNYESRHSGNGGEFNALSPDFVPATMGYKAKTTYNGGVETFSWKAMQRTANRLMPKFYCLMKSLVIRAVADLVAR